MLDRAMKILIWLLLGLDAFAFALILSVVFY